MPARVLSKGRRCCRHSAFPVGGGCLVRRQAVCPKITLLQASGESWKGLLSRLLSARKFARVNALALRKISKKHDKVLGSRAGHQFLQVRQLPVRIQCLLLATLVRPEPKP